MIGRVLHNFNSSNFSIVQYRQGICELKSSMEIDGGTKAIAARIIESAPSSSISKSKNLTLDEVLIYLTCTDNGNFRTHPAIISLPHYARNSEKLDIAARFAAKKAFEDKDVNLLASAARLRWRVALKNSFSCIIGGGDVDNKTWEHLFEILVCIAMGLDDAQSIKDDLVINTQVKFCTLMLLGLIFSGQAFAINISCSQMLGSVGIYEGLGKAGEMEEREVLTEGSFSNAMPLIVIEKERGSEKLSNQEKEDKARRAAEKDFEKYKRQYFKRAYESNYDLNKIVEPNMPLAKEFFKAAAEIFATWPLDKPLSPMPINDYDTSVYCRVLGKFYLNGEMGFEQNYPKAFACVTRILSFEPRHRDYEGVFLYIKGLLTGVINTLDPISEVKNLMQTFYQGKTFKREVPQQIFSEFNALNNLFTALDNVRSLKLENDRLVALPFEVTELAKLEDTSSFTEDQSGYHLFNIATAIVFLKQLDLNKFPRIYDHAHLCFIQFLKRNNNLLGIVKEDKEKCKIVVELLLELQDVDDMVEKNNFSETLTSLIEEITFNYPEMAQDLRDLQQKKNSKSRSNANQTPLRQIAGIEEMSSEQTSGALIQQESLPRSGVLRIEAANEKNTEITPVTAFQPVTEKELTDLIEACDSYQNGLEKEKKSLSDRITNLESKNHPISASLRRQEGQLNSKLDSIKAIQVSLSHFRKTGLQKEKMLIKTLQKNLPTLAKRRERGNPISSAFWALIDKFLEKLGLSPALMGIRGAGVAKNVATYFAKKNIDVNPQKEKQASNKRAVKKSQ